MLTGQVNPSGKITSTWYDPKDLEIMPIGASSSVVEDGIRYANNDYGIKPKDGYPGRTYMYYTGTPVYPFGYGLSYTDYEYSNIKIDKTNVTSADKVKVSVDVQNTGNVKGTEVVQLYIQIPGGDGIKLPKMQLKNFARVELEPQEKKTVDMEVNIKDLHIFDEQNTKTVVPVGEYSVIIGKNCQDQQAQVIKFNVTEEKVELDKVSVLPDGITVKGISANDGTMCIPENEVKANLTAYMSNEVDCDLSKAAVKYTSSNPDVAVVSDDGTVTAAKYEGIVTIDGSVTVDGVTKTASFPIVVTMKQKVSTAEREEALKQLADLYTSLHEEGYTTENWTKIQEVYQTGKTDIEEALDIDTLNEALKKAVSDINAVETKELKRRYNITSVGNDVLKNGFVGYGENAIPAYVVTETSIKGTVTPYNPFIFELEADYFGQKVSESDLIWSIEKLDDSGREAAQIDSSTGKMTITENGLYKVTAKNIKELKCGEALIYVNLQIEGERADVTKGNIADEKKGASGASSGGNNLGSTKSYWTEFKGVKLDYLNKVLIRSSKSSETNIVNVSLAPNDSPENVIASAQIEPTGSWEKWRENELTVNQDVLKWAKKDENGLASVYIQMNGANLDFFRLIYDGVPDDEPIPAGYFIKNTKFGEDGLIVEVENYSDDKVSATLYGAVYDANGALKNEKMCNINDAGEFVLPIAKPEDDTDTVKTFIWNDNMEPLANSKDVGFVEPTAPPTPPPTATPTSVPDLGNEWKVTKADEGKKHGDYVMNNLSVMFPLESVKNTNKVIDDVAFTNYITYSHTEWPIKDESIDTTTLKFEAKEEGYLVVYACDLNNYKEFIISRADVTNNKVDEAGKNAYYSNSTGAPTDISLGINVVPGYTYYIYAPGTKARFVGAKFKPLQ